MILLYLALIAFSLVFIAGKEITDAEQKLDVSCTHCHHDPHSLASDSLQCFSQCLAKQNNKISLKSDLMLPIPTQQPTTMQPTLTIPPLLPIEMAALEDIYDTAGGKYWVYPSGTAWNFAGYHNPCVEKWQGVTCNTATTVFNSTSYYTVQQLNLQAMNMSGIISVSIGNFAYMIALYISSNSDLTGPIPAIIGDLPALFSLSIASCGFNETIPESVCNLAPLMYLAIMSMNHLTGTIPDCLGNLTVLFTVIIENNPQITGSISHTLGNIGVLTTLYLTGNALYGSIPANIAKSTSLQLIDLSYNLLTGSVPASMFSPSMKTLNLQHNYLEGSLPASSKGCPLLTIFHCDYNMLTGPLDVLSTWVAPLPKQYSLQYTFTYNSFSGPLPSLAYSMSSTPFSSNLFSGSLSADWYGYNLNQQTVQITNNYLTGSIPGVLFGGNYTVMNIMTLDLHQNYLSGSIISNVATVSNSSKGSLNPYMTSLILNDNLLTGSTSHLFGNYKPVAAYSSYGLAILYLQSNFFMGPIILPITKQISFVDVSSNSFTGTLPVQLLSSNTYVVSFAASENCLAGTIPSDICTMSSLIYLNLDGLSAAAACRDKIFHTFTDTYTLKSSITGGIPECLFDMSRLQTLHISGNNIDWSFPSDMTIGSTLTQLSLPHNNIVGSIPRYVTNKGWVSLDLSYNKLSGVIDSDIAPLKSENQSLKLDVNRLSGFVPSHLLNATNINILNGNLFSCDLQRNGLPSHDTNRHIYQCGSNSFDQSAIVWSSLVGCLAGILLLTAACYSCRGRFRSFIGDLHNNMSLYLEIVATVHSPKYQLTSFCALNTQLQRYAVQLTLIVCVVGLPLFAMLFPHYGSLSNEYAWAVSAAFLTGDTPAFTLFAVWAALILGLFVIFFIVLRQHNTTAADAGATLSGLVITNPDRNLGLAMYFLVLLLGNCALMVAVNGAYVYILLNYGSPIVFASQISMALFKLNWNGFVLQHLIIKGRKSCYSSSSSSEDGTGDSSSESSRAVSKQDNLFSHEMTVMSFLTIFNTIIAPCLATAVVDPSCFLNAFVQPPVVTSNFPQYGCSGSQCQGTISQFTLALVELSYPPPFNYSYQCSSSILTNYASVYVYMFSFAAFFKPLLVVVLSSQWCKDLSPTSYFYWCVEQTTPQLIKPSSAVQLEQRCKLFQRDKSILRIIAILSVFLTFGVVFPPLAVVLTVALLSETSLNQYMIGRFLISVSAADLSIEQFAAKLREETANSFEMLLLPLATTAVPFAAVFYAYFLFDIYGDKVGLMGALSLAVPMACMPIVIATMYHAYCYFAARSPQHDLESALNVKLSFGRASKGRQSDIEMPATADLPHDAAETAAVTSRNGLSADDVANPISM